MRLSEIIEEEVNFMKKVKRSESNKKLLVSALIGLAAILGLMFNVAKEFEPPINFVLYGIVFIIGIIISLEFVDE